MSAASSPATCSWNRDQVAELVRMIAQRYAVAAAHGRSVLELEVENSVCGLWDRLAAEEIVENLLSNALKFGMGRPVTLRLRSDGRSALLQVQDRGVGMAPDQQTRIFGQFEQVVGQHRGTGFGVGLWVASRLVAAMHGQIEVSSRSGEGSTFSQFLSPHRNWIRACMSQDKVDTAEEEIGRVPSLVPGLDQVLCGGFLARWPLHGPGTTRHRQDHPSQPDHLSPGGGGKPLPSSSPSSARTTAACWCTCARCGSSIRPLSPTG